LSLRSLKIHINIKKKDVENRRNIILHLVQQQRSESWHITYHQHMRSLEQVNEV